MLSAWARRGRFVPALFAGFLLSSGGAAHALNRDQLRAAVPLPQLDFGFEFSFGGLGEPPQDEATVSAQIAQLSAVQNPTSEQLLRLAQLYSGRGDTARSKESYERALPLLRAEVEKRPDDGALLLQLGKALNFLVQPEEAATVLRRATEVAPQNVDAWTSLSEVLVLQATKLIIPVKFGFQFHAGAGAPPSEGLSALLLNSRPDPLEIGRAQALLLEARACDARAVATAPPDADIYTKRMGYIAGSGSTDAMLQTLLKDKTATRATALAFGAQGMMGTMLSPEASNALQATAHLRPNDANANGAAAFMTISLAAIRNQAGFPLLGGLASLPALEAEQVREDLDHLKAIAQQGGKNEALALESLGVIEFGISDPGAIDTLRRAVQLDPTRVRGREMLLGLLSLNNRFDDMVTILHEVIAREDTARNRMFLAKSYDKLDRPHDAQTEVDAALKDDPNDLTANLALAALLLRADDLAKANQQLSKAANLLAPPAKATDGQRRDYALMSGVFLALSGKTDEGRKAVQDALATDASGAAAQKLLAAVNF